MLKKIMYISGILFLILYVYFSFDKSSVYYLILKSVGSILILILIVNFSLHQLKNSRPTETLNEYIAKEKAKKQ
jgi:phosphoglycerol transferase MdoB-like AlkP superfamily enzyme